MIEISACPCEAIGNATIYCGDALDIIPALGRVNCAIMDPPYMIGVKSDWEGKLNPFADMINGSYWFSALFSKLKEKLPADGAIWTCLNWRSIVTYSKASFDAGLPIESLMVWDKDWIGPGGQVGLRPCYEMVALLPMDKFAIPNRGLRDIQKFKWCSTKPSGHPAEKPEALMDFLISNSTRHGDIVLDPFMGSGTVGASALRLGRRYIGIELDPKWFNHSADRLRAVNQQTVLDSPHDLRAWVPPSEEYAKESDL